MNTNSPEFVSLLAAAIWWRDYATHLSEGRRVFPTSPYPALYQFTPAPPPGVAPQERAESGRIRLDPDAMPPEERVRLHAEGYGHLIGESRAKPTRMDDTPGYRRDW